MQLLKKKKWHKKTILQLIEVLLMKEILFKLKNKILKTKMVKMVLKVSTIKMQVVAHKATKHLKRKNRNLI